MVYLVLHDIRSNHNVGSIFRTADAAGVDKIFLTGYTPTPQDKFERVNSEIAKTALGAEKTIPWEYVDNVFDLLEKLKTEGCHIIALEQAPNSVDYKKVKLSDQVAIVVGNEVGGVDQEILKQCDLIAEIPMRGKKESLNVSVAAGILLFRLLD